MHCPDTRTLSGHRYSHHHNVVNLLLYCSRYKVWVLVLTYIAYTAFHLSRKPISVVKSVLNQNCSALEPPPGVFVNETNRDTWCDWAPFGKFHGFIEDNN